MPTVTKTDILEAPGSRISLSDFKVTKFTDAKFPVMIITEIISVDFQDAGLRHLTSAMGAGLENASLTLFFPLVIMVWSSAVAWETNVMTLMKSHENSRMLDRLRRKM